METLIKTLSIISGCIIGRMIYDAITKTRHVSKFTFKIERGKKDER